MRKGIIAHLLGQTDNAPEPADSLIDSPADQPGQASEPEPEPAAPVNDEQGPEPIALSPYAMIVTLGQWLRLRHRGVAIDMPNELDDQQGIKWYASVDYRAQEVLLSEIHNPYDIENKVVIIHRFPADQLETLFV